MIILRELTEDDLIPLAEFLAGEFPHALEKGFPYTTKEFWLPMFDLWWTSNPAYSDRFPKGWVLENDTSLVGFMGNIPVKFLFSGEINIVAAANGWYVNPSVRGGFSLRLLLKFVQQKNVSTFLFKIEDESFIGILSKFKFEHYILPKSQREYAYIIDKRKAGYIFLKFLLNEKMPGFSQLPELYKRFGFLLSAYVFQNTLIKSSFPQNEEYTSSVCTVCDESFSRLWDPIISSCNVTISRDVKTLNWLYFSQARFRKRLVIQCHRSADHKLAGYMVFDVQRIKTTDEATLQLMDMCIEDDNPRVISSLISFAIESGKQNGASLLLVWGNSPATETYFRTTFPMRRRAKYHRYIRFTDTPGEISSPVCPTMIFPPQ
jgi:hypothetical protein